MKKFRNIAIIALAALVVFGMAACDNGTTSGDGNVTANDTVEYVSNGDDGRTYHLEITKNAGSTGRAAYQPSDGDTYVLTVTVTMTGKLVATSTGTVVSTVSGEITLQHDSGVEFTVSVTVSGTITAIIPPSGSEAIPIDPADDDEGIALAPPDEMKQPGGNDNGAEDPNVPPPGTWNTWTDPTATATVSCTVSDGVAAITVGGVAQTNNQVDNWGIWKAQARYGYAGKANTSYTYEFEAWTQSGSRFVNVEYYGDNNAGKWLTEDITITSARQTFTIKGYQLPKDGDRMLGFRSADQLGTFYVKILSITESEGGAPPPETGNWFTWTDRTSTAQLSVSVDADGVATVNVAKAGAYTWDGGVQYGFTAQANKAYEYTFEAWTQSGERTVSCVYYWDFETQVGLSEYITFTPQRKTYTVQGDPMPKGGERNLDFHCGDQAGIFYVKVLSIKEYDPASLPNPLAGTTWEYVGYQQGEYKDGHRFTFTDKTNYVYSTYQSGWGHRDDDGEVCFYAMTTEEIQEINANGGAWSGDGKQYMLEFFQEVERTFQTGTYRVRGDTVQLSSLTTLTISGNVFTFGSMNGQPMVYTKVN